METAAEIWNEYLRFNLVWVFAGGVVLIVSVMRRQWWKHWKGTGDDRLLGLNVEALRLMLPLLIWMIVFGVPATILDAVLGPK